MSSHQPLNHELVEARFRDINDALHTLDSLLEKEFKELKQIELLGLRYLVIQLVEAAASICIHIIGTQFNERAGGFPDCFIRLSVKGLLPDTLAERLASAGRLRNILVHRYWKIDDEMVYSTVKSGRIDFKEYTQHIRGILNQEGQS